jgi:nucleotidyltransferase substrate binding protein (TIGR01987 family)
MENQDIRWKQRFENFENAFLRFQEAVENHKHTMDDLIKAGIIQRFEFTNELSWKVMKDFLIYEGIQNIIGSRSAVREALNKDLITNGEVWMEMIETRNTTVHGYDEDILKVEFLKIIVEYYPCLENFYNKMKLFL